MDSVIFKYVVHWKTKTQQADALRKAFPHLDLSTATRLCQHYSHGSQLRDKFIKCSLEQFARFIIYRNETGIINKIRELEPEIIFECEPTNNFDLRPRT